MSKRKLAYQFAGGVIGLVSLNLAFTPNANAGSALAGPQPTAANCSNCSGAITNNGSNAGGYYQYYPGNPCNNNCGYFEYIPFNGSNSTGASNSSGFNIINGVAQVDLKKYPGYFVSYKPFTNTSNGSGVSFYDIGYWQMPCCNPPVDPPVKPNVSNGTGGKTEQELYEAKKNEAERSGKYVVGIGGPGGKAPAFFGADNASVGSYGASNSGLSRQILQLLNAASADYADKSAKLAAIESQTAPAKKDDTVRYSRVADANADCGCNASAAAPDNSVELAAAKKAEAEAAASLAKAQQQAREFLEAQKKAGTNVANGTQFTPIW
jgi:hypothetical protein